VVGTVKDSYDEVKEDHGPRTHHFRSRSDIRLVDQGGEWSETAEQGDAAEKRWGNRLNWMKKWGHRVGREYGGEAPLWSKRWGSRVCLQAHCGSLANNRHAYVACGQNFCSGRR